MKAGIEWSLAAENDLERIWDFLFEHDSEAAERLVRSFDASMRLLGDTPLMGRARPDIGPNIRAVPKSGHLLIYRYLEVERCVQIVRILHQRQDLTVLFE